jgi:hypothetical protein
MRISAIYFLTRRTSMTDLASVKMDEVALCSTSCSPFIGGSDKLAKIDGMSKLPPVIFFGNPPQGIQAVTVGTDSKAGGEKMIAEQASCGTSCSPFI